MSLEADIDEFFEREQVLVQQVPVLILAQDVLFLDLGAVAGVDDDVGLEVEDPLELAE